MKIRRFLSSFAAAAVAVSAVSVCSYAALFESNGTELASYNVISDPYIDYSKVAVVKADMTFTNNVAATGCVGVNTLEGEWISVPWTMEGNGTLSVSVQALEGIYAPEDEAAIFVQVWDTASPEVVYTVDELTLYDADGNVITAGDEVVVRPDVKFPDAEPLDVDNDDFCYAGDSTVIDIAQAVGEDFGSIGTITAAFKWGELCLWNGNVTVTGVTDEDGNTISWYQENGEIGNLNDFAFLSEDGVTEYTYTLYSDASPAITDLIAIGSTGEISGYGALEFGFWGQYAEETSDMPEVSNISFYDKDGELIAELNYETSYDEAEAEISSEEESTEETPVDTAQADDDTAADNAANSDSGKGSPDTGAEGIAVAGGIAAMAAAAVIVSKKRK